MNSNNKFAKEILLEARLEIKIKDIPNKDLQIVCRKTTDNKILKIISTDYQSIGANVFIDDEIAQDGEYTYFNNNQKLIVKNGKIMEIKLIQNE